VKQTKGSDVNGRTSFCVQIFVFTARRISIVQGSGIGPTLWLIMESHLHPLSDANVIFKYADDTNLLVPENTDCTLADEFSHIKRLADTNGLIINFDKTKELLLIVHTLLGITSRSLLQVLSRSLLLDSLASYSKVV